MIRVFLKHHKGNGNEKHLLYLSKKAFAQINWTKVFSLNSKKCFTICLIPDGQFFYDLSIPGRDNKKIG